MGGSVARRLVALTIALAFALAPTEVGLVRAGVTGNALNDSYQVNEDRTLEVSAPGVLANDGPASPALCVEPDSADTSQLDGDLTLRKNGSFEFTPSENFNGSTSFTYRMGTSQSSIDSCPEGGQSNAATVTIIVNSANDPPFVSTDQCAVDIEVAEDSGAFDAAPHCVQMQDFGPVDENNQNFNGWLVSNNNPDLFSVEPAITQVDGLYGRLTFTPAPNANGRARVSVRGRDTGGTDNGGDDTSDPTRFFIDITPVNDAPTSTADTFQALPGQTLIIPAPGVLKNDADVDGDALTAELVSEPTHGSVTLGAKGGFSYTPDAGYLGPDAFSYRATDGSEASPTRAVTINVTSLPTPIPTAATATEAPSAAVPTAEVTLEPSASAEASASAEPVASESALPGSSASLAPSGSPAPGPVGQEGGGLSIAVLVVGLLALALLAFGGAFFLPKWLESRKGGGLPPEA